MRSSNLAGASRVAVRKDGTLSYLLADHLGSSSISTDAAGTRTSELRYKAWGESRYSFGTLPTKYTFTGQYSYMDDSEASTPGSEGFGLMYYGAPPTTLIARPALHALSLRFVHPSTREKLTFSAEYAADFESVLGRGAVTSDQ